MLGEVVVEIGADCAVPIDLAHLGAGVAEATGKGSLNRLAGRLGELFEELIDEFANDLAGGFAGFCGDSAVEGEEGGDEVDVGFGL